MTKAGLKPIYGSLLSVAIGLVLLVVFESVACAWESRTAQGPLGWTLVASRRMPIERRGLKHPFFVVQPDQRYLWEGIEVRINSRGFRDHDHAPTKAPGVHRILNVGDSVAFGWEVALENTYGKQLESHLNDSSGRRFQVIQAGVPGWDMETARNFLLEEGLSWQPDSVVLGFTTVNDVYAKSPLSESQNPLFAWLRDRTYSWPFLTTQLRYLLSWQRGPEAFRSLNPWRNAEAYFPLDETSPVWDRVWGPISEIADACRTRQIELVMLVFPSALQLNSANHPSVPQEVLGKRAAAAGIGLIDLLPVYWQACQEAGPEACEGYENLLFADVWMHPNRFAHRLAAEEILRHLDLEVTNPSPGRSGGKWFAPSQTENGDAKNQGNDCPRHASRGHQDGTGHS